MIEHTQRIHYPAELLAAPHSTINRSLAIGRPCSHEQEND